MADDEAKLLQKAFSFGKWWGDTSSRKEKLYFETELKRRTALLDDVRRAYLKDVFAVRQQLEALQNGSKSAQPSPLPSLTMDLRMYGSVPQHFAKSFDENPQSFFPAFHPKSLCVMDRCDILAATKCKSLKLLPIRTTNVFRQAGHRYCNNIHQARGGGLSIHSMPELPIRTTIY